MQIDTFLPEIVDGEINAENFIVISNNIQPQAVRIKQRILHRIVIGNNGLVVPDITCMEKRIDISGIMDFIKFIERNEREIGNFSWQDIESDHIFKSNKIASLNNKI